MSTGVSEEVVTRAEAPAKPAAAAVDADKVIAGRWRLESRLGRGGFAETWRATDLETGSAVAVKVLSLRSVDHWKAVEAFEREARVLAGLEHPHIPRYIAFVPPAEGDDRFVLVQALAPGTSLADRLRAGWRPSEAEVRAIASQLLETLVFLHGRSPPVVHRDIKPGNVMLDDSGHVSLIDFGSVRDRLARESELGSVAGTFGYIAPEQLSGQAGPASDLYSLGVTLVHVLSHRAPSELPQKALKLDFARFVNVSAELVRWLDRLIEPVPEARFPSAREALAALTAGPRREAPPKPSGGVPGRWLGSLQTEAVAAVVETDRLEVTVHAQPRPFTLAVGAGLVALSLWLVFAALFLDHALPTIIPSALLLWVATGITKRGVSSLAKTQVTLEGGSATLLRRIGPLRWRREHVPASEQPTLAGKGRNHRELVLRSTLGDRTIATRLDGNVVRAVEARARQHRGEPS